MSAPDFVAWAVDAALVVIVAEAVVVLARRRARRAALLANLAAGLALMLGLRAALADAAWPLVLLALTAAGAAHGGELLLRRRDERPAGARAVAPAATSQTRDSK